MSAREKSDLPVVAEKRANKAASAAAELVERRGGAKENAELQSTVRTQSRAAVSQAQARIREAVTRNRQDKLTALLHHLTIDVLRASFFGLKKTAAPGVDEMTWTEYAAGLEENLTDLHSRVQTGAYRALPSRRTYIPKADGRQRPLGIAALEDKIVQAAVVAILTPIYEAEFLGFSYGFRPKRNQQPAPARQTGRPTSTDNSRLCCVILVSIDTTEIQSPPPHRADAIDRFQKLPAIRRGLQISDFCNKICHEQTFNVGLSHRTNAIAYGRPITASRRDASRNRVCF